MPSLKLWERYRDHLYYSPQLGLQLDISRMNFPDGFFKHTEPSLRKAFASMADLEAGIVANPDENRMVGHYWLRTPSLAPTADIRKEIESNIADIRLFVKKVHSGELSPQIGGRFTDLLVIGIGGSALGPQFVADTLGTAFDPMKPHFFDNTDPDGMDRVLISLGSRIASTLTIVISKSGGTVETRNGMIEAKEWYAKEGLSFSRQAVAITGAGSALDRTAEQEGWLARFPMWDWVGGRTSVMSAVGLLPAALQGLDIDAFLEGARLCDAETRSPQMMGNPAALLALMWLHAAGGRGEKDMVILPYKDRLLLLSRYLQQLIMESLGKEKDLSGRTVHQGLTVYGNKGSTDQHAFVQQLREGVHNFFVTFIEVLKDRDGRSVQVEPQVTAGDYLFGFLQGTRQALYENGRESVTLTVEKLDARTLGVLIALYERAVGLYAALVGINAYHQPGVEAGKKAAGEVIALQRKILDHLTALKGASARAEEIAAAIGREEDLEAIFKILQHLAANPDHKVVKDDAPLFDKRYAIRG